MLILISAALAAAQPAPAANMPAQHAQAPQSQMAPMGQQSKKDDCCKDCCKDMAGKEHGEHADHGSGHGGHSAE